MASTSRWWLLALGVVVVIVAACETAPKIVSGSGAAYPYSPQEFRVHSLSRFVGDSADGFTGVELWIEFLDGEGQTARGVGHVQAQLTISGRPGVVASLNLDDRSANAAAWDPPLRMYRMKIEIKPPVPATPPPTARVTTTWSPSTGGRVTVNSTVGTR